MDTHVVATTERRRRPFKRFTRSRKGTAQKWYVDKKVNRIWKSISSRVEKKFYPFTDADEDMLSTNSFVSIFQMTTGDNQSNRTGKKITYKSVSLRYHIAIPSQLTGRFVCRVMLVMDHQTNAAIPLKATLLLQGALITQAAYVSGQKRYSVLLDRTYAVDDIATPIIVEKIYRKLRGNCYFNEANNGTIEDIKKNSLYFLYISSSSSEGNVPQITYNIVTRYTDQ